MNDVPESVLAASSRRAVSYREIVGSAALMGGSSAFNIALGMVRTKAMALLLGPAGYGLMATFQLVVELARTLAQMGLNASGVRQIAAAQASGDAALVGMTVSVLRWTALGCGVLGGTALALLAVPVSTLTFGTAAHASSIVWLGLAVLLSVVAAGQGALLQGLRRIGDLSRMTAIGGLVGTAVGVPMIWTLGPAGVAPTLVVVAAAAVAASWWYARRIRIEPARLPWRALARESRALLGLGLAFMASAFLTLGASYAARVLVVRDLGLGAAGLYQAAWTVGGLYSGFVLQAMGTDFYPRLVALIADPAAANQLVNEQAQVGLLIALPGVVATLALAPLVIPWLYAESFRPAVGALRWICIGMLLRVVTWPLGFVVVALDRRRVFVAVEAAWAAVNVALTWLLVRRFGVDGAGMAFVGAYLAHAAILYPLVRQANGFRWSRANVRIALGGVLAIVAAVIASALLAPGAALATGMATTFATCATCAFALSRLVDPARLPAAVARVLSRRAT
jgi:antigen flippase